MRGCRPLTLREQDQALAVLQGSRLALRNRCLVLMGLNTGFRISELLSLRLGHVLHLGQVLERVCVERTSMKGARESRDVALNLEARTALAGWIPVLMRWRGAGDDVCLFQSNKGGQLTRRQASRIMQGLARTLGWPPRIGTHSLRKTFAHDVYDWAMRNWTPVQENPIRVVMRALGHSSVAVTESYLNLDMAQVDKAVMSLGRRRTTHANV